MKTNNINNRGNSLLYVMFLMLFIISILVTYNTYKINMAMVNTKTNISSEENEFLNSFEKKIQNKSLVHLYEPTVFTEEFNGKTYTAEVEPSGNLVTKPVKETYTFNWDATHKVTSITYNSISNNQQLVFSGNNGMGTVPEYIMHSIKTDNVKAYVPYSGTLANPTFGTETATKVRYRIGEAKYNTVIGYPTNKNLDLTSATSKDLITVEYLNKNGKSLGWSRFIKNNNITYSNFNQFLLSRLPNTNRVVGTKEIVTLINNANKQIGVEVNQATQSNNSMLFANKTEKVCYYWEAYGNFSTLSSSNLTKPKYAVKLANSPCNNDRYWSEQLDTSGIKLNPWINGFHNLSVSKVNKIKSYNAEIVSGSWKDRFYCSDPKVKQEVEGKVKKAMDKYKSDWDAAVVRFNADYRAAYDNDTAYPSWSSYQPPQPAKPTTVPCISEVDRDTKLVQYEEDDKLTTQLMFNLVNNVSSDYTIEIEHLIDKELYPVKWTTHYLEGTSAYRIDKENDNRAFKKSQGNQKITISRNINNNYDYNNLDLMGTYDHARASVTPRAFNLAIENSTVNKVTITTKEFKSAEFKFKIKNSDGTVLREKKINITDGQ